MERIAALLFAATLLLIFSYLLFFSSMGQAGNGGEYWGFNGYDEPSTAARASFEDRDYRFLKVFLVDEFDRKSIETPGFRNCDNHPLGIENALRPSTTKPMHGRDSPRLARQFATQYNQAMMLLLAEALNYKCLAWTSE